jgi:hypothetical protein
MTRQLLRPSWASVRQVSALQQLFLIKFTNNQKCFSLYGK